MFESLCNKVAGQKACNFIKYRLEHRCFSVNIAKSLRTAFFIEHLWRLLLSVTKISEDVIDVVWDSVLLKLRKKIGILY